MVIRIYAAHVFSSVWQIRPFGKMQLQANSIASSIYLNYVPVLRLIRNRQAGQSSENSACDPSIRCAFRLALPLSSLRLAVPREDLIPKAH